jgi:hypothetical protein
MRYNTMNKALWRAVIIVKRYMDRYNYSTHVLIAMKRTNIFFKLNNLCIFSVSSYAWVKKRFSDKSTMNLFYN